MTRVPFALLVPVAAALFAGCAPRFDVNVAWTIDGFAPADECGALTDATVQLRLEQRDSQDASPVEETTVAKCGDAAATVQSAAFSNLFLDLVEKVEGKDVLFGTVGPIALAPGAGAYPGEDASAPVNTDIALVKGRLHSRFTVIGQDCGDAGAQSFTFTLRENSAPLGEDVVVQDKTVTCAGGTATFDFEPVTVGASYDIVAKTTIDGVDYATTDDGSGGAGALVDSIVTDLLVDLDVVGRP